VAVLLSRFPLVTETFILREVIEMERQGQPVRLVPLLRESPAVLHHEAVPWTRTALYTPFVSPSILAANARAARRAPRRYGRLLGRVLRGAAASPHVLFRTLALLPKCAFLAERLREEGVGHVHAHFATHPALAALVVSALEGIPYSVTVHAHDLFVRRVMLKEKLAGAAFVRTVSDFNRRFLAALHPDLADRLEVIHVGVDPDAFAGAPPPPGGAVPRLLCVAALKPYKGLSVLVEACRRLRNEGTALRCDIVGEGPERRVLEAAILRARLHEHVRLLRARPQHEVARLLAESDAFVLPSVVAPDGQMEGIPVALMEAMASGRPVVASALSGIPELVEDGVNGLLVPAGDAGRLADAIKVLLADPSLARRLGEQGRETVRREFRLDATVGRLLERIDGCTPPAEGAWAERLAASRPGWAGRALGLRRVSEGRDAAVAELLVSNGARPRGVVLKVHRTFAGESAPPAERARREFDALARLQSAFAGRRGIGVPRPLELDGDALLMEPGRGERLDALLRATRWSADPARAAAVATAVRRAGLWLRLFHRATAREAPAAGALERLVAGARADLESAAAGAPGSPWARRVALSIDLLARRAAEQARRLVGLHGDFWPGNVLVSDDEVQVIDLEGFGESLPAEELAGFVVQLELYCCYPGLAAARASLRAAFLAGYGERPDPATYDLCRLAAGLRALRRPAAGRGVGEWWRRRALRHLVLAR
jgi:glycosyltransferase involved in cell wall biosynthesis/Ser/Thr protein kinase RdoA (MazF antagonist)